MTLFTRDTQVSRVWILVHHFEFSLKTADLTARLLLSCPHDLPQMEGFGSFFTGNSWIVYLSTVKYGRKANLSTKSCSDISELEDNKRNCSECKKMLEKKKVSWNTRSCQKVAEELVESPRRDTALIWVMLLTGWSKLSANQKHYPDLGSVASSVWNFCPRFSDVISRGK